MVRVGYASKVEKETFPIFKSRTWPFIQGKERESHGGNGKKAGEDRPKLFWHSVMVSVWIIWFTTYLHTAGVRAANRIHQITAIIVSYVVMELEHWTSKLVCCWLTKEKNSQLDQIFSFGKTSSLSELGTFLWMIVKVNVVAERGEELEEKRRRLWSAIIAHTKVKVFPFFDSSFPFSLPLIS